MHDSRVNKPMCFEFIQVLIILYKDLVYINYHKMCGKKCQLPNKNIVKIHSG